MKRVFRGLWKGLRLAGQALWTHRALAVAAVEEVAELTAGKTDDEIVEALRAYGIRSDTVAGKSDRSVIGERGSIVYVRMWVPIG